MAINTPFTFSANTAQPSYEDGVWDERNCIRVRIAAPNNGWYFPGGYGYDFGYIEGFSNNFLCEMYYEKMKGVYG